MPDWFGSRKKSSDSAGYGRIRRHAGFYAIEDPWGSALDAFDEKFDLGDSAGESARKPRNWFRWSRRQEVTGGGEPVARARLWQRDSWRASRKRWWAVRIVDAMLAHFIILVAWLDRMSTRLNYS